MLITAKHSNLTHWKSELTVVFITQSEEPDFWINQLQDIFGNLIDKIVKGKEFGAEEDAYQLLHGSSKTNSKRIDLVGLGDPKDIDIEAIRRASARAVKAALRMKLEKITFAFPKNLMKLGLSDELIAQAIVEGALLANYRFDKYQTGKDKKKYAGIEEVAIITEGSPSEGVHRGVQAAHIICDAVNFARDLANAPGNELPPRELADRTAHMCRKNKIKCSVYNEAKIKALKMGGILGVSQGSAEPPRMIIMEYKPAKAANSKPIVLVGKGLTFDAGGISIKPAQEMDRMKFDMSGGAAVIGIMQAVANLKLPLYVVGIVPSSENLLGSRAYKPGDVLTMYSGKTVEVVNTDAEGRLILADALAYAQKYKPETIVDFATLTGHVVVALGTHGAGMMGTDDKMKHRLLEASKSCSEKVWELPLWKEFDKQIKSHIADIKNTGGRNGGASTAGAFLKHFVGDYPWVHIDIAGTANSEEEMPYTGKISSTGYGIRLMVEALRRWHAA
jgi:leucyl aminopeptidase